MVLREAGIISSVNWRIFRFTICRSRDLDSRLDYYTPVIIANNDTLENKPEMVKKFLATTEKAMNMRSKTRMRALRSCSNILGFFP
ncbi:MAG: ABC transporter substrate-binding protein [Clostridium fessum]